MKIDFNKPLLSYKGEPMWDQRNQVVLAKDVICDVLSNVREATNEEKMELANLVREIWQLQNEMEITPEQCVTIRKHCKGLPVSVFAQIYKMLE